MQDAESSLCGTNQEYFCLSFFEASDKEPPPEKPLCTQIRTCGSCSEVAKLQMKVMKFGAGGKREHFLAAFYARVLSAQGQGV